VFIALRCQKPTPHRKPSGIHAVLFFPPTYPAAGEIGRYQTGDPVEPVITTSRGKVVEPYATRVNTTHRWRIVFDLDPEGTLPVDMRAFLRRTSGEALTETWLYQHLPGVG